MIGFFGSIRAVILLSILAASMEGQTSTGSISGIITDQNQAVIPGAAVTIRNSATGFSRSAVTDRDGRYSFSNLSIGVYELTISAANFARYVRSGLHLLVDQDAVVNADLKPGDVNEVVTVDSDASLLNTSTAEVATRFDTRRLSELPIAPNRDVFNILYSVPGVARRASGQPAMLVGAAFSVNGGRIRSNSFLLDGQDVNDPTLTGGQIPLNNPDAIQEVRIVTNQFLPEYGHNAGSSVNFVGKSGTNDLHGSIFWFHNDQYLNACSNLDKRAGFCDPKSSNHAKRVAPFRLENQIGFTIGGPVVLPRFGEGGPYFYSGKGKTFFFTDFQRWSDRQLGSGLTLKGAPTADGRAALEAHAGDRPHVQALLRFVPAGIPNGQSRSVAMNDGAIFDVELGDLAGSSDFRFDNHQGSVRIDHRYNEKNLVYGRYRYSYEFTSGIGQVTPPGLGTKGGIETKAAVIVWTSSFSPSISSETMIAWKNFRADRDGIDADSAAIPSIQINNLGMTGTAWSPGRTAIGLAPNLPAGYINDTYQISEAISVSKGKHTFKFGVDLRRTDMKSFFFPSGRGSLVYTTLSDFVNDFAETAAKTLPLAGGDFFPFYRRHEFYSYAQDHWRIRPDLTLTYGVRYEYPGDSFKYFRGLNKRILSFYNNNPEFKFEPDPETDVNNWMPRIGFNWNPKTNGKGIKGFITGAQKLVLSGGYARTYDPHFFNINTNVFHSFPFVAPQQLSRTNAFAALINTTVPNISNPRMLDRGVVAADLRAPATDQISLNASRELSSNLIFKVGYIRTRGTGLFQTIDGNPYTPCAFGTGPGTCNTSGIDRNTGVALPPGHLITSLRVDPSRGAVMIRANSASSTYDALQVSLDKRISRGFSFAVHYTWSAFIDTASEIFGDAQDSGTQDAFDRNADRARSRFDQPHRLSGNGVFELPFFRKQKGPIGKLLGGWQINAFFNFNTGVPFTPSNGSDPTWANALAPSAIRPNVYTNLDLSGMSVARLYLIDQQLRAEAIASAELIFNSLPPGTCVPGWLPGPPLPFTLFSAPRGRITCQPNVPLVVDFIGILEGQRVGNAGRNILRSDGIRLIDIGIIKNTRLRENVRVQAWANLFNAVNSRNFGIPSGIISSPGFLDKWATDGGNRRIILGGRLIF
ncbi:MAG: TonB-dependent receptor [Acidobacteria bacterium]|nr:TonB-dependent receptor [Acidobacteriota bacterium]